MSWPTATSWSSASTSDRATTPRVALQPGQRLNAPVSNAPLSSAYSSWSFVNERMTDSIHALTDAQLGLSTGPGRWPLWAVMGHAACQRVFWFCDVAGEPGADSTPFTDAAWNCPGDDDLDHPLSAAQLVTALSSTFAIVERALSQWTVDALERELPPPEWGDDRVHTRGSIAQRVFTHDVWHASEASEILTHHGLPALQIWP
jgi:hypothetical protein